MAHVDWQKLSTTIIWHMDTVRGRPLGPTCVYRNVVTWSCTGDGYPGPAFDLLHASVQPLVV